MSENKRFELTINERGQADIIDRVESKEKNAVCIYNDLGVLPFSSAKAVCDKLNEQDERIKELEKDVDYWKQVASQYSNELNVFEHCKKYKTKCKDIYWSSDVE